MTANEYRERIFEMLKRPPASLSTASIQRVRAFKEAAESAKKAALAGKPSLERLQRAYGELSTYYQ
jgi:muconolactone delta-isomerase